MNTETKSDLCLFRASTLSFAMLVFLGGTGALQAEEAFFSESLFPKKCVGNPEFETKEGKQSAGTAVLTKIEEGGPLYILTVRHLLGPSGGFAREVASEELGAFVEGIRINGLFQGKKRYKVEGFTWPTITDKTDPLEDLAVFKTGDGSPDDAAFLATALPAVGDPVWMVAKVRGGVEEGQMLHRAVVTYSMEGSKFQAAFDNPNIITSGASGAPVFDATGKVLGIYTGHSKKEGKVFAFVIPSPVIIQVIKGKKYP